MNTEIEIWKDVPDYEGLYQVSSFGRVKSLGNLKTKKEKIIKQYIGKKGYYFVNLNKFNKGINFNTHKLIAKAFLNHVSCGMKLVVDHIDRNKLNNTLNNLRIVSNSENLNNRNKKESKGIYTYLTKQKIVRYCAYYSCKGKKVHLGVFCSEFDAKNELNKISL